LRLASKRMVLCLLYTEPLSIRNNENTLEQVFADPQVKHRGMRLERPSAAAKDGTIPGVRTPIMIDGAPMAAERPSPRLGEHTDDILREIGEA
jgi:glutaryl-CoA transferase